MFFLSFSLLRYDDEKFNETLFTEIKEKINTWCYERDSMWLHDLVYEAYEVGPKIKGLFRKNTAFTIRHLIVVKAPQNSGLKRVFPDGVKPKDR